MYISNTAVYLLLLLLVTALVPVHGWGQSGAPGNVDIVTALQHNDHGADDPSPLVGDRKMKRGLALAGAVDR